MNRNEGIRKLATASKRQSREEDLETGVYFWQRRVNKRRRNDNAKAAQAKQACRGPHKGD